MRVCLCQHQQQVAAAVERAKQVTMQELNAIIGVSRTVELTSLPRPPPSSSDVSRRSGLDLERHGLHVNYNAAAGMLSGSYGC